MFRDFLSEEEYEDSDLDISVWVLATVCCLFIVVGYYAGWGRFVEQPYDWDKHNAVLSDLVSKSYPVYYLNQVDGIEEHSMLTYYIAQYLLPALFGKIFNSFRAAEIVNFIWAEIGLLLVYLNIIRVLKINVIWIQNITAFLLCFFSGPLLLAQKLQEVVFPSESSMAQSYHWAAAYGEISLQYSSNYVLLRWVLPQVLIIWLVVILFIEHKERIEDYVILMLPAMLAGALPFIALVFTAFGNAAVELFYRKSFKTWIKQILSLSNAMTAVTLGGVLALYYYGNVFGEKPDYLGFFMVDYSGREICHYLLFIGFMVCIYKVCIFKENIKNPIYWINFLMLVCIPLFRMGLYNDWVMRCSIPNLFILLLLIINYIYKVNDEGFDRAHLLTKITYTVLAVMLMTGFIHPLEEFAESVEGDDLLSLGNEINMVTLEGAANRYDPESSDDYKYNYFSYDIEDNIFYRYIARRR